MLCGLNCSPRTIASRLRRDGLQTRVGASCGVRLFSRFVEAKAARSATVLVAEPRAEQHPSGAFDWLDAPNAGVSQHAQQEGAIAAGASCSLTSPSDAASLEALDDLSMELSTLMEEVETELDAFLSVAPQPAHPVSDLHHPKQDGQQEKANAVALEHSAGSLPSAAETVSAVPSTSVPSIPAPLSGLSLLPIGHASVPAASAGASRTSQKRKRNWQRPAAATEVQVPDRKEDKFTASGRNSLASFLGTFTKDRMLSSAEETLLASAAQDFMRLQELSTTLRSVIKRQPSTAELAETLQCDEKSLRERIYWGNRARSILAQRNYRLVVSIAKKMVRPTGSREGASGGAAGGNSDVQTSMEDAIAVGMEGLLKAMRKFKPDVGYKLSTYATWWIRQYVQRYLRGQQAVFSLPVSIRENLDKLERTVATLLQRNGTARHPSIPELAAAMEMTEARVLALMEARRALQRTRSMEAPLDDAEGSTAGEGVAQDDDVDMAEGAGSSALSMDSEQHYALVGDLTATVDDMLSSLDEREADLVRASFGLDSGSASAQQALEAQRAALEQGQGEGADERQRRVPGAERLQISTKGPRNRVTRVLKKLRARTQDDGRLLDYIDAKQNPPAQLPGRTPGYAKKQH